MEEQKKRKHSIIISKTTGCAMQVQELLGNGFQEIIIQRSIAIEMQETGLQLWNY